MCKVETDIPIRNKYKICLWAGTIDADLTVCFVRGAHNLINKHKYEIAFAQLFSNKPNKKNQ